MKINLFKRYLILGVLVSTIFFIISVTTTHFIMSSEREDIKAYDERFGENDYSSREKMIDFLSSLSREQRIQFIMIKNNTEAEFILLNQFQEIIYPLDTERDNQIKDYALFELKTDPKEFIKIGQMWNNKKRLGPPPPKGIIRVIGLQLLSIVLAISCTLLIIFFHFKGRTNEIESVLMKIKNGDLKARMPIGKHDEYGLAMNNFNKMADEIESLVNRLRQTESTRRSLLSELAHDIRTPLASVINLLEIYKGESKEKLSKDQRDEIIDLSYKEVNYISHLVEDLLFLGRIEEPSYRKKEDELDLTEILIDTLAHMNFRYPKISYKVIREINSINFTIDGVLAHRLFRNIIENAFSFAKNIVLVKFTENINYFMIEILDDGVGFGSHGLLDFGNKKFSRQEVIHCAKEKRISIGLGSVIAMAIVKSYHGELIAENNIHSSGAKITIKLPKA